MLTPVCTACGMTTYPARWCDCDPRFQTARAARDDEDLTADLDQVERERDENLMLMP